MREWVKNLLCVFALFAILVYWRQKLDVINYITNGYFANHHAFVTYITDPLYIILRFLPLALAEGFRRKFFSKKDLKASWTTFLGIYALYFYLLVGVLLSNKISPLLGESKPLFPTPWVSSFIYPILILFITNFVQYWIHRAQHSIPFLWRYHKVHHSIRHLNCYGISNHVSEHLIAMITTFGVSLFFPHPLNNFIVVYALLELVGPLIHTSARFFNFGVFRLMIADALYHRTHHVMRKECYGKNLALFPILDIAFGTYLAPKEEYFDGPFGVEGLGNPRIRDFIKF